MWILLVMVGLGDAAGGMSAEFNTRQACEDAIVTLAETYTHGNGMEAIRGKTIREHSVCVPKG